MINSVFVSAQVKGKLDAPVGIWRQPRGANAVGTGTKLPHTTSGRGEYAADWS